MWIVPVGWCGCSRRPVKLKSLLSFRLDNAMLQELWSQIETASGEKLPRTIANVAEQYDDMMLSYEVIPDEAVDFLVKVFSSKNVLHARGIEHFLLEINVDFCKYTQSQRATILAVLVENIWTVSDELGRHSIGDFIARAYPPETAFATFLYLSERSALEKHVAFVGLDVLRMRERKTDLYKRIDHKWHELLKAASDNK